PKTHYPYPEPSRALLRSVIGRLFGDRHVMHVALANAGRRDADQRRFALERGDVLRAAVAHAGAKAAYQLMHHRGDAALMGDTSLDAFRHQLVGAAGTFEVELVLEIAVAAAAAHRTDQPHAPVLFEAAALIQDHFARALVRAREEIPHPPPPAPNPPPLPHLP